MTFDITESRGKAMFLQFYAPATFGELITELSEKTGHKKAYVCRELIRNGVDAFIAKHGLDIQVIK